MVRAVCLIPGASEFGYETSPVMQAFGLGVTRPENRHISCTAAPTSSRVARRAAGAVPEPQSASRSS